MAFHFIAILGTSIYIPTKYGDIDSEEEFVQIALLKREHKDFMIMKDSKITILCTEEAKNSNWHDRKYTPGDIETLRKRKYEKTITEGTIKKGLETQLYEFADNIGIPHSCIEEKDIPSGKNQEELMEIFNIICDQIKDEDEIVFDITHGFRSIPVMVLSAITFARNAKSKVSVRGIYYGAFEAKQDGITPVFNIKPYLDIMEWSQAITSFAKYGNSDNIYDLAVNDKGINKDIKKMVERLHVFTLELETSRGFYDNRMGNNNNNASFYYSIKEYKKISNTIQTGEIEGPWKYLLDMISIKMKIFLDNESYNSVEQGLAAVKWAIDNHKTQQGYTALEETIKTYLCLKYGLGIRDRKMREAAKRVCLAKISRKTKDEELGIINQSIKEENLRQKLEKIYDDVNPSFSKIVREISSKRNSLSHFGYDDGNKAFTWEKLERTLEVKYNEISKEVKKCYNVHSENDT